MSQESALFTNRELSWLEFNRRVLDEARDPRNPVLERVKFLAIASTNLDEFFEIRVAGTMELVDAGLAHGENPDHLHPRAELQAVRVAARQFTREMHRCWKEDLVPALAASGIRFPEIWSLDPERRAWLRRYFEDEVFPVLTPLAVDPAHPFPSLLNKSLNLAVVLLDPRAERPVHRMAMVQVPRALPRLVRLPDGADGSAHDYVFTVDIVEEHLETLFPGLTVLHACSFRLTRDSNLDLVEEASTDLMEALEQELDRRRRGEPVRLELSAGADPEVIARFLEAFELEADDVYECDGPVNLGRLMELYRTEERRDLKDPPFLPCVVARWESPEEMFTKLRAEDVLLHHPYESFGTVELFVQHAANDPHVLAIKHTIYRAGETSSIVRSLIAAAEARKQVTVVVELKARFDEEANIRWAKRMERAGIHVVYGIVGLKTHAKATLVVRRDEGGIRHYCHLGSGNYNPTTARIYTDVGLLTAHEEVGKEVAAMFNMITGYAKAPVMKHLVVAPHALRSTLLDLIRRETQNAREGKRARIRAKMNAIVDPAVIKALYEASQTGVEIELCVRGICCLRPGVPGLSERIRVVSVVGRFLEHSRIYWFENSGGEPAVYLASADWMPRNLDRRVEQAVPILDRNARAKVTEVLETSLRDNQKSHLIQGDGSYVRVTPKPGEEPFDSQESLRQAATRRRNDGGGESPNESPVEVQRAAEPTADSEARRRPSNARKPAAPGR
ncbi:MAG: polyphosphate kinase 1 [Planctomycetes bacterium]|nr:polyphosphate kinase 1 [Planctomycetota bacterium]